jgi:hypothetical protein
MLRDAKAEYEVIGLQYYHSGRDLLEWERDLESFNHFGKPIHITEMGFPSSLAPYPGQEKYAYWGGGIGGEAMVWHGEFTATIQADYIESDYTLADSKPFVEAITYWDFNPIGHDGFIRGDGAQRGLPPADESASQLEEVKGGSRTESESQAVPGSC